MAFELKQNLKLSQQLIMTPQLQQAIKLLQLSRLEMLEVVQQEMEENPLLEEVTAEFEQQEQEQERDFAGDEPDLAESESGMAIERTIELTGEGDGKEEFDWNSYLEDYRPVNNSYERGDGEAPMWDNMLSARPSLLDHLMWQLKLTICSDLEMQVGEQIIGNIDQDGYLRSTLEEMAAQENVGIEIFESVLRKVQEFDPPGVGARDLKECLMIQSRILGLGNGLVAAIIQGHLHDLERKDYPHIARKLKVSLDEVVQAVMLITRMDPKPGSIYAEEKAQTIIPDVYIFKVGDEYQIVLNEDGLPRLRINNYYRELMSSSGSKDSNDINKRYMKDRVQSASWLIKSILQRQKTIYKVAESIIRLQRDFFERGIQYLKPLVLRDIAEDVEMHESTISRVVTNKYMHTPRGVFELKYFFSSSIQKTDGDATASRSVKEEIRKIIAAEDAMSPFSDQEIVERLKDAGISIARRTVAKYREMMRILPSSRRKKYF